MYYSGKHSFKLYKMKFMRLIKMLSRVLYSLLFFFLPLFHFPKHLPFIEDKPKLKFVQTMSEKQAGETDENADEEIDKVKRKQGILYYVISQNYQIIVIHVGYSCFTYYQHRWKQP